jgi:hypothetical protein
MTVSSIAVAPEPLSQLAENALTPAAPKLRERRDVVGRAADAANRRGWLACMPKASTSSNAASKAAAGSEGSSGQGP